MPGLILYISNRLEILAEKLTQVVCTPLSSPLQPEIILVQSKGMERWVSMELARHNRICANCRFPFPNHFAHRVFRELIPDLEESSPFAPEIMTWKIMEALPRLVAAKGFENLRGYLSGESSELKRFQLSQRIAELYDQYLLFRPAMMLDWDKGRDTQWQATLWREVTKGCSVHHRAALRQMFFEMLREPDTRLQTLPERISVFGISALPPYHVEILAAVARMIEVHLFLMNPCKEYWGDLLTRHEKRRIREKERRKNIREEDLHLEQGNTMLTSMGMLGREFFELIEQFEVNRHEQFEEPPGERLISQIQHDILNLRDRAAADNEKIPVPESDDSIRIHSCHSPMREIEVLQDRLLALFEADRTLLPKDILVMTPDIATYAPFIQAVFSIPTDDPYFIPFSIADRSVRHESQLADAFLSLLELQASRFGASRIMDLLDSPSIAGRFSLTDRDLAGIRLWVRETRICWGLDGDEKKDLGLPPIHENTWRAGLDRMLLGYTLPGRGEVMFKDILPYDDIEGGDAMVLGNFMDFCERLFALKKALGESRSFKQWSAFLLEMLDQFFTIDDDTERDITFIRRALEDLGKLQERSGFDEEVPPAIIKSLLSSLLEQQGFGHGFLTGGVTFCAMLPMRSIPFRVICLLGMNDNAYPRQTKPLGFDLISKNPMPGDRSRRKDDRYLFLECLLSVRDTLHISYVGQNIQDNSIRPPSVLVSELLDYIAQGFKLPDPEQKIRDHVVTKHHLQAFNPEYFGREEEQQPSHSKKKKKNLPRSYSKENYEAAKQLIAANKEEKPFITHGLSDPPEEWKTVDINQLCRFFSNPAKFLLNARLGIYLDENRAIFDETEPIEMDALERYNLEQEIVEHCFAWRNSADVFPAIKASGRLPHGTPGEMFFRSTCGGIESFMKRLATYRKGYLPEAAQADLQIGGFLLKGNIENVCGNRLIHFRYANVKSKDRLKIWICHLIVNLMTQSNDQCTSILVCKDHDYEYSSDCDSGSLLQELLGIYWGGLTQPIHFFPESSLAFAEALIRKQDPGEALIEARKKWEGNNFIRAEGDDRHFKLCFGHTDPLDEAFEDLALKFFEPLMKCESRM